VTELVDHGVLHPTAREICRLRTEEDPFGREIAFYRHQTDAFEVANRRESYVLTTGTGSGKSMAYSSLSCRGFCGKDPANASGRSSCTR
jgi:hypothetical protein